MMTPPKAEKRPYPITIHGDTRVDDYYWLRDDERADRQVLDYLQAENAFTDATLKPQQALRETLYEEMVARIPQQEHSVPYVRHGFRYQTRYEPGNEYALYVRQPETESERWETLLDGNQRGEKSEFYTLGGLDVSPDNQKLAVAEDFLSRRQYDIRFKDLSDDSWADEVLENTSGSFEWANDSATVYYVRKHAKTLLPYQVYRHRVGTDPQQDELIYEEQDDTFYVGLEKTTSERFILIHLSSTTTSEILLLDADCADSRPQMFVPRRKDHEYAIDHYRRHFYIRSNKDGKNFGLYQSEQADEAQWQRLIAPRAEVMLEGFSLFRDWLVVEERSEGLTLLRQIHWQSGEEKRIAFDDPTYTTWLAYNPEPETALLRYGYSSMTTPSTLYELNLDSGERVMLKQQEVKNFTPENYRSERVWVKARDGVEVPVSLVYRQDSFRHGGNPLMVYGYGSYGSSMDPAFSASRLSLLDRGFVFALAHIRGGGELGQLWYEDGKLFNKQNTFNDFIDVTETLIAQGYGDAKRVFAMGGSAGGLLMGAVINQAPQLYHGVVAQVPFVDVVTTMLDESIPLTTGEYDEWGNPNEQAYYDYIKQYSPYDQVKAQDYPHMLVTTGLHDSQVQYWEPAKWVAKLRELKTDDRQLLLYTDMDSGHGGKSGRFKAYEDIALEYAFILALAE
ncbi:S9 family peptidase [Serratia entomophila]|uniref:S9 family peptidase n=1 Tax=Serratia entomophila TaxID=42906 RepID=UPI002177DB31|nr:prolyl oligopeptidase family serine peptidase [Serratia entomophila]CAI0876334.1 Protease 2 [Serratia entomophila]CAI1510805.1 Protease 2 [Serratia entomophila]CAI1595510.1 Protease 2 [Serratia entomophila]CAI1826989.1 Protease 2 [Serratia entomophila]CAI1889101.1 Protease 2 [Serratia entomophila]